MDLLTVAPTPSGVSWAYTDLITVREVDMMAREECIDRYKGLVDGRRLKYLISRCEGFSICFRFS